MTTRNRMIGIAAAAGLVLLAIVVLMRPQPLAVETAVVAKGTLTVTVDEEGTTRVRRHDDVNAPVAGTFVPAGPRAGDRIAAGTVLGTIRSEEHTSELQSH